jgi:DNA-binding SARP family transcriptional activator
MRFDVLGPVRVTGENGTRQVTGARQQILLVVLLAHPGKWISNERLIEYVWEGKPRSETTLRSCVKRLREDLGPELKARILNERGSYQVNVGPGELDVLEFESLYRQTRTAIRTADWTAASDHAAAALALWRGGPPDNVLCQPLRDDWLKPLEQQRLQAAEWQVDADLQLGRYERLVPRLQLAIANDPHNERFRAQLMRALALSGRRAEALAVYRDTWRTLTADVGVEPGDELQRLHQQILDGDEDLAAPPTGTLMPVATPATAVRGAGVAHAELSRALLAVGDLSGAAIAISTALAIFRTADDDTATASAAAQPHAPTLYQQALSSYQQALSMGRELQQPAREALGLQGIGECLLAAGNTEAAVASLKASLEIYEQLGMNSRIDHVRACLAAATAT